MGVWGRILDVLGGGNTAEEEYEEVEQLDVIDRNKPKRNGLQIVQDEEDKKVISNPFNKLNKQQNQPSNKVVITQPHQYDDATEIVDYLKMKKSVIVNLEFANKEEAKKIVDFLSGAAYGIDGSIQKISNLIFLVAPNNVEVHNEIGKEDFRNKLTFSWLKQ